MSEVSKLINLFDTNRAAARSLGVSANSITKWSKNGFLPPGRALPTIEILEQRKILHDLTLESLLREAHEAKESQNCRSEPTDE